MSRKSYTKIVHEGDYVAQVDVELIYTEEGWSPCLSLEDAQRLDDVREALKKGDVETASKQGRIYTLTRIAGWKRQRAPRKRSAQRVVQEGGSGGGDRLFAVEQGADLAGQVGFDQVDAAFKQGVIVPA